MKSTTPKKQLQIKNLHVEVEGKEILHGINITFYPNEVHALMGPNGSGKSTLALTLMGHPKYKITKGQIIINGQDITNEKPEIRAKSGLFLSFQNLPEIEGISLFPFLRNALNTLSEKKYSVLEFQKILQEKMSSLKMDPLFSKRHLHHGLSGGEKKRLETLQLLLLKPKYALLDETDSGLDVDALKTVAAGIKTIQKEQKTALIVITHYHRFLQYLKPDHVSIISKGKIVVHGDHRLAKKIEKEGFEKILR